MINIPITNRPRPCRPRAGNRALHALSFNLALLGLASSDARVASGQVFTWDGDPGSTNSAAPLSGNWNVAAHWTANAVPPSNATNTDLRFNLTQAAANGYTSTNNTTGAFLLNRIQSNVTVGGRTILVVGNSTTATPTNSLRFVNNGAVGPEIQSNGTSTGTPIDVRNNIAILTGVVLNLTGDSPGFVQLNGGGVSGGVTSGAGGITINRTAANNAGGVVLPGANTFAGGITLNTGRLAVGNSSVVAGGVVTSGPVGTGTLTLNGGIIRSNDAAATRTLANAVTLGGNVTFGETTTNVNPLTLSGPITLTGDRQLTFSANTGALNPVNTTFSGVIGDAGGGLGFTKLGASPLILAGTAPNTFTGQTTVGAGTLSAAATGALGGTNAVLVNTAGTLLLDGSGDLDRVNNAAGITLGGGTLARGAGASEGTGATTGLGALTLTGNSILDFGTGAAGTLTFDGFTPGAFTLTISGYNLGAGQVAGTDGTNERLIFFGSQQANLNSFAFNGFGTGANQIDLQNGYFEVVPVPEPSTVIGALGLVGFLGFRERRRLRSLVGSVTRNKIRV